VIMCVSACDPKPSRNQPPLAMGGRGRREKIRQKNLAKNLAKLTSH